MLTGNTAVDNGGAVTCLSCGELSTQMTTFSNNTAAGGYGGGLQCVLTSTATIPSQRFIAEVAASALSDDPLKPAGHKNEAVLRPPSCLCVRTPA